MQRAQNGERDSDYDQCQSEKCKMQDNAAHEAKILSLVRLRVIPQKRGQCDILASLARHPRLEL
jgi:hypothetical protein